MRSFCLAGHLFLSALYILFAPVFAFTELSDDTLRKIPGAVSDFDVDTGSLLAPILITRVPGTPGQVKTQQHFVDFFATHLPKWTLQWQNSTYKTPATANRDIPFSNLIFRRDPPWAQSGDVGRLTLVAHYDSKYLPEGFIGATDSAAPCAMLLHVARSIDEGLTKKWDAMEADGSAGSGLEEEKGVQILLLDGEESWISWTDTDSLYGARSLAEAWDSELHPAASTYRTPLDSISLFVLLDLLGAKGPVVPSYFQPTHWAYQRMASIESRMRKLKLLASNPPHTFLPDSDKTIFGHGFVLDDHVPFMTRGVDILHLIPNPFPDQWHTMMDDGAHLDVPTVDDWAKIITAFTAEWMDLDGLVEAPQERSEDHDKIRKRNEL